MSPSPYRRHVALPLFPSAHQYIMIDGLSHTFCSVRSASGDLLVFPWWRMLARNQPLSVDRGPPVLTATYSKFSINTIVYSKFSIYHNLQQMILYRATVYFSGRKREERRERNIRKREGEVERKGREGREEIDKEGRVVPLSGSQRKNKIGGARRGWRWESEEEDGKKKREKRETWP